MKDFPIMIDYRGTPGPCPSAIPWEAISPYQGQAQVNHQQTLERLAERGGLSPLEAFMVMNGRSWRNIEPKDYAPLGVEACAFLNKVVRDRGELETKLAAALLEIETMKPVFDAAVAWVRNAGCPPFWGSEDGKKLFLACGKHLLSEKKKCIACDTIVQVYGKELCDSCHAQDLGSEEICGGHS